MGDDPCECVFDHETAMRRLLSLLRDSQGYCTDSECIQDLPGPPNGGILPNNLTWIVMLWGIIALAMFFLRPNSMRSRPRETEGKPDANGDRGGSDPPAPGVH